MNRHLLDVNVLFALVWPGHEAHAAAHSWFSRSGHQAWATNPLTQLGVLRLLTNPVVVQGSFSAASALAVVTENTRHAGHEFWPLSHDLMPRLEPLAPRLQGHRQWTDALLLVQAIEKRGVLVTFDSGLNELAAGAMKDHLLILKRR